MSRHTPGPWKRDRFGNIRHGSNDVLLVSGVALPCGNHPNAEEADANARLIAAAPDYHAATEAIREACANNAAPVNLSIALKQLAIEGEKISLDAGLLIDLFAAHAQAEVA
jgi:hypothetical protein